MDDQNADNPRLPESLTLGALIRIDRKVNSTRSFLVLLMYRLCHALYVKKSRVRLKLMIFAKNCLFVFLSLDAQISYKAEIGHHIRLPHSAMGVVISPYAVIRNNISIFHQVTLGVNENLPVDKQRIIIEDNCYLSAGSKIISCRVGAGSKIAPNAVVFKDVPENSLCFSVNQIKSLEKTPEYGTD